MRFSIDTYNLWKGPECLYKVNYIHILWKIFIAPILIVGTSIGKFGSLWMGLYVPYTFLREIDFFIMFIIFLIIWLSVNFITVFLLCIIFKKSKKGVTIGEDDIIIIVATFAAILSIILGI